MGAKSHRKNLVIFFVLAMTLCPPAQADTQGCSGFLKQMVLRNGVYFRPLISAVVNTRVVNYSNSKLSVGSNSHSFKIDLGPRLNFGMVGSVYPILNVEGSPNLEKHLLEGNGLVAKLPHKYRSPSKSSERFRKSFADERKVYDETYTYLPFIEADEHFPKNPSWNRGTLPTAPILADGESEFGRIYIKPFVSGMNVDSISKVYHPTKISDLPPEMIRSLRDLYEFAMVAYIQALRHSPDPENVVGLDLNPPNLVWVSDPAELKRLHFNRPGFTTYEFGEFEGFRLMTFDSYLESFFKYVKH